MHLSDILAPAAVVPALRAASKKQLLQDLSTQAARLTGLGEREIFDTLLQRERLGSTGVGAGIAIPHGKLAKIPHVTGLFVRLERPIDFEAVDGEPVDLVFLLLASEAAGADHLRALSRIARSLRDPVVAQKLRMTRDAAGLYAILCEEPNSHAA